MQGEAVEFSYQSTREYDDAFQAWMSLSRENADAFEIGPGEFAFDPAERLEIAGEDEVAQWVGLAECAGTEAERSAAIAAAKAVRDYYYARLAAIDEENLRLMKRALAAA